MPASHLDSFLAKNFGPYSLKIIKSLKKIAILEGVFIFGLINTAIIYFFR